MSLHKIDTSTLEDRDAQRRRDAWTIGQSFRLTGECLRLCLCAWGSRGFACVRVHLTRPVPSTCDHRHTHSICLAYMFIVHHDTSTTAPRIPESMCNITGYVISIVGVVFFLKKDNGSSLFRPVSRFVRPHVFN